MGKLFIQTAFLIWFIGLSCGPDSKKEGSRFNRMDETSPEYQAKASEYMMSFFNSNKIPVDSIKVDGPSISIKIDTLLPDSLYRVYASKSAIEYYKFKKKTTLLQNRSVRIYCVSKRGQVAQAIYP